MYVFWNFLYFLVFLLILCTFGYILVLFSTFWYFLVLLDCLWTPREDCLGRAMGVLGHLGASSGRPGLGQPRLGLDLAKLG